MLSGALAPISDGYEAGPVEGMSTFFRHATISKHGQCSLAGRRRGVQIASESTLVQRAHPLARGFIINRPQAHDQRSCPSNPKRPPETEDALPDSYLTNASITGREYYPLRVTKVEPGDFFCR